MAVSIRDDRINSSAEILEVMNIQHRTIALCMNAIFDEIADNLRSCAHVNGLLDQLELLCQNQFRYDEQLLEEVNFPSVADQKNIHGLFLKAITLLKAENTQCHTPSFINDFIDLRLDFILNMNKETMMLCDFIISNHRGNAPLTTNNR